MRYTFASLLRTIFVKTVMLFLSLATAGKEAAFSTNLTSFGAFPFSECRFRRGEIFSRHGAALYPFFSLSRVLNLPHRYQANQERISFLEKLFLFFSGDSGPNGFFFVDGLHVCVCGKAFAQDAHSIRSITL